MKRNSLLIAILFIATVAGAQTVNLHMKNGMVVNYNSSEVDYIDFAESSSDPASYTSCPDGNHPHLIDLGLPSGTKWACCNVGASKPEEYGGYYAWGETVEKSTYDWSNYILCDGTESTSHYIGSDIAGTNYDVAHGKWGGSWKMPSYTQLIELIGKCSTSWTTLNGVNGYVITGPNGASIFLPASGYYGFSDKFFEGSVGLYWSSTYNSSNKDLARYLRFDSGRLTLDYYLSRNSGQPVRAVCVEKEDPPAPTLEGTWEGRIYVSHQWDGRYYDASYSYISFDRDPYRYAKGYGYWVDEYSGAPWDYIANHISWTVRNSDIIVYFEEDDYEVTIYDYSVSERYFDGYIYTYDNKKVYFHLVKTSSPNWNNYHYGWDYWDSYYYGKQNGIMDASPASTNQ